MGARPDEVESPILELCTVLRAYSTRVGTEWVCRDRLCQLFELEGTERICFVAKTRADRSTYRVNVRRDTGHLTKPIFAQLYSPFLYWLEEQIDSGRPNIGVRIVEEEPNRGKET